MYIVELMRMANKVNMSVVWDVHLLVSSIVDIMIINKSHI